MEEQKTSKRVRINLTQTAKGPVQIDITSEGETVAEREAELKEKTPLYKPETTELPMSSSFHYSSLIPHFLLITVSALARTGHPHRERATVTRALPPRQNG
jgi:hypothetical protein